MRELLGDRVTEVVTARRTLPVDRFAEPAGFRDLFKRAYGPTVTAYRTVGDDPERTAELDAALDEVAARAGRGGGPFVMDWEYLLLTARRA